MTRSHSRGLDAAAAIWGFAEATFFFLVPDLLLTRVACRSLREALRGAVWAVAGAITGGVVMAAWGAMDPDSARALLHATPGIGAELMADVRARIDSYGLLPLFAGPLYGVPYKIYAVEWGAHGGSLLAFVAASVPARGIRFVGTALLARAIAVVLGPLTRRRSGVETALWLSAWSLFYLVYFGRMGW